MAHGHFQNCQKVEEWITSKQKNFFYDKVYKLLNLWENIVLNDWNFNNKKLIKNFVLKYSILL